MSATEPQPPADPESVARAIVLRRLTAAPRTRAELAKSLAQRNVPDDVADRVLDRFTDVGLINDVAYAQMFTESRRSRSGWSGRAIAAKLHDRGVDRDTIDAVLAMVDSDDETRTATDLVRRRWQRLLGLDQTTRRRRLAGMLSRRGYSSTVVHDAIAQVESEMPGSQLDEPAEADPVGQSDVAHETAMADGHVP